MTNRRSPRGVLGSGIAGLAGGALGWALASVAGEVTTTTYARLDQVAALALGAAVGGVVLALRARRLGRALLVDGCVGAIVGGAIAMAAVSLPGLQHFGDSPRAFLLLRVVVWTCAGAAMSAALTAYLALAVPVRLGESTLMGAAGGAAAALIMMLPGFADLWQVVAFLWFGFAVAVAVCGPELWHAIAVITVLPPRGREWSLWLLREMPLHDGTQTTLGAARFVCIDRRVAVYPPAGGVTASGHRLRRACYLTTDMVVGVGRLRGEFHLVNPA